MSIQKVPQVPFAQIANSALRDSRLSFKARGILALVLSHSGEWTATLRWLESQSQVDGRAAIQSALRELTSLGYRSVHRERYGDEIRTIVTWRHESNELISRPTGNLTVREPDGQETGSSLEHYSSEHNSSEQHEEPRAAEASVSLADPFPPTLRGSGLRRASSGAFEAFWTAYPRKASKAAARRSFDKALRKTSADVLVQAAERYRDDPNRDPQYTAHASTWLNNERWLDEPLPARRKATAGDQRIMNYQHLYETLNDGREIES